MIHLGDIKNIKGDSIPIVDCIIGGSPCFIAGTLVLTDNGYKEIEQIKIGDNVMTHNGRFMPVVTTMINEATSLFRVEASPSENLYCTGNHPFYVRKRGKIWENERRVYTRVFDKPTWVNASELTSDYYVGTPVNKEYLLPNWDGYEFYKNQYKVNKVHINELSALFDNKDFWYIVGRYIGDGWLRSNDGKSVVICCNKKEINQITDRLDATKIHYCVIHERAIDKVQIVKKELYLFLEQFGHGAANKHLTRTILNLPVDMLHSFVNGYMESDGCFTNGKYSATTVSRKLIYDMSQCILKAYNRPISIYLYKKPKTYVIEGRIVNQKDIYSLVYKMDNRKQDRAFYEDGYIWSPINNVEEIEYKGFVYNIEVKEDNSYVAQNIIVHNCQDLSIAGNRAGLSGERSGLFIEQIRVIKEMRKYDKANGRTGKYVRPRFMVWENVPGSLSSNGGGDFRIVLEETAKIADENAIIPRPPKDKWTNSGCIMGDGWSIAWRIFDAQFWGVPQRRRRISLVADFGGECAPEILFERESVPRDTEKSGETRKGTAGNIESSTYPASTRDGAETFCIAGNIIGRSLQAGGNGSGFQEDIAYTLTSTDRHAVCQTNLDKQQPIMQAYSFDSLSSNSMKSSNPYSGCRAVDIAKTLDTSRPDPSKNQGGIAILCKSHTLDEDEEKGKVCCLHPDISGIICASGAGTSRPAGQGNETDLCIVQAIDCNNLNTDCACDTLQSKDNSDHSINYVNSVMCMAHSASHAEICDDLSPTLTCHHEQPFVNVDTVVRRLTPLECERLQGYKDGWTDIDEWVDSKGRKHKCSDAARYKALGNSIALPSWVWLLNRLCKYLGDKPTMGSLFDGIGGFPLIWENINGKGSCLWASEIDSFCIAVTQKHFGEGECNE